MGKRNSTAFWEKTYMDEWYERLNLSGKRLYDKILKAVENRDDTVSVLGMQSSEMMQQVVSAINYDHPEIFYVDFQRMNFLVSSFCISYQIRYIVRKSIICKLQKQLNTWVADVKNELKIDSTNDEVTICRKVHNYLINHVKYNYDALQIPDIYSDSFTVKGVFEQKKAVCEGISKSFKLLCNCFGIDVFIMTGTSRWEGDGREIAHAWNIVKLNKGLAHVDVTWDLGMSESCKNMRYDYFMIPDKWINKDHDFVSICKCSLVEYSYFNCNKSLLSSVKKLNEYLDAECKRKNKKIYFKIVGEKGFPEDIIIRVQKLVERKLSQTYTKGYSISMAHNETQKVFYFEML